MASSSFKDAGPSAGLRWSPTGESSLSERGLEDIGGANLAPLTEQLDDLLDEDEGCLLDGGVGLFEFRVDVGGHVRPSVGSRPSLRAGGGRCQVGPTAGGLGPRLNGAA